MSSVPSLSAAVSVMSTVSTVSAMPSERGCSHRRVVSPSAESGTNIGGRAEPQVQLGLRMASAVTGKL